MLLFLARQELGFTVFSVKREREAASEVGYLKTGSFHSLSARILMFSISCPNLSYHVSLPEGKVVLQVVNAQLSPVAGSMKSHC